MICMKKIAKIGKIGIKKKASNRGVIRSRKLLNVWQRQKDFTKRQQKIEQRFIEPFLNYFSSTGAILKALNKKSVKT